VVIVSCIVVQMAQHKIQSSSGLTLELEQVPKMLGKLTREWAPHSFVVSFKLETDESILFKKAGGAIKAYDVDLVVANLLHNRTDLCYLVAPAADSARAARGGGADVGDRTGDGSATPAGASKEKVEVVEGRSLRIQVIQREAGDAQIEPVLVRSVIAEFYCYLLRTGAKCEAQVTSRTAAAVRRYVEMVTHNGEAVPTTCGDSEAKGRAAHSWRNFVVSGLAVVVLFVLAVAPQRRK
jgi:hypothetical protein